MDKYNQNETVLAQALAEMEQANKELIKENKAMKENLKSFSEKLATLSQSMVTWENHQQVVKDCMEKIQSKANELAELNLKYDSLVKERRYWATQQWARHLFRWLFLKRHLWIWVVYALFTLTILLSVCNSVLQQRKIVELQNTQMKYRFIKAIGAAPKAVQFLEDAYEQGYGDQVDYIEMVVTDYEKAMKLKADSIVRSESQKVKNFY